MTGAELIIAITEYRPDIPTILCTDFSEIMNDKKAKTLGINRYITKPITLKKIAKTIRDVLDEKGL